MFLKTIRKSNTENGKEFVHYRLTESYRLGGNIRHRTVLNLGSIPVVDDNSTWRKLLADRLEELIRQTGQVFDEPLPDAIEQLAQKYYALLIEKRAVDMPAHRKPALAEADYQDVDINSVANENIREIGAESMCKQIVDKLDIAGCLKGLEWNDKWTGLAITAIISRAVFPSSEHRTEQWLSSNSGLGELMGQPSVSRHQLYRACTKLYENKEHLERFLADSTHDLLNYEDKILLFDLTNTYFEGRKKASSKAKFAKSKEKRNDARLMAMAMVVNAHGFVKYTRFYAGNMRDSNTLKNTIEDLEKQACSPLCPRRIVVMDAGIATEDNLAYLRGRAMDYLCVSLRKLKDYHAQIQDNVVKIADKRDNSIELKRIKAEDQPDNFLYVHSKQKSMKENSMEEKLSERYIEELQNIESALHKKGGTKKIEKVWTRIGRLQQKYPRMNKYFDIRVEQQDGIATRVSWNRLEPENGKQHGVYFIRTTLNDKDEKDLWTIYNTIREIENTFRILKTDLKLRPIHHQEDLYSEAHMYCAVLAYQIVSVIRYQLKQHNFNYDWSNIVRIMNTQKLVTTSFKGKDKNFFVRQCSRPSLEALKIYKVLGLKSIPLPRKKSVVPH